MSGISSPTRLTGFSGTLDTESLIKKLMQAESQPLNNVQKKKQLALWKREDYQTVNTALLSFRNTVNNLRFEKNFEKVTATSSNTSVLNITSSGANIGTSNVAITQLAESATLIGGQISAKSSDPVNVSGTVTIKGASGSADITFTSGQSTIDSIVKDINSNSVATGVTASFDQSSGRLFLTSTSTGAKSTVDATGAEFASLFNLTKTTASGKDAEYTVNGTKITASSNNVTISGAQVLLSGIGTATIGSKVDRSSVIDDIKKFVEQYNSLVDTFSKAYTTKKNRDYQPLTDDQKDAMPESDIEKWEKKAREGTLYNDTILKDSLSNMRRSLNTPLNVEKGQISMLSEIGITVKSDWRESGKLEIDETKLEAAINTNFDQVKNLFVMSSSGPEVAGKSNQGIADRMYKIVNDQMSAIKKKIGTASIDSLDDSVMGKQLRQLSEQEVKWKSKLQDIEDRYYKQFTAMEKAIQKLNSQQSSFASMLGG